MSIGAMKVRGEAVKGLGKGENKTACYDQVIIFISTPETAEIAFNPT